ncbi:MAG: FHA domain-containing protein [Planctomycetota bacterium]
MLVQLIVHNGPLVGTIAPIKAGYYLVGRHQECQIRPESRSVSRRHCLLLHNEDGFGVFDLRSSWGTYVNNERLEPHVWRHLRHDDVLRVGDLTFRVCLCVEERPRQDTHARQAITEISPNENSSLSVETAEENSPHLHRAPAKRDEVATTKSTDEPIVDRRSPKRQTVNEIRFRKPTRRRSLPSFSFPQRVDWKLMLAILGLVSVASHFAFRLYRLQAAPGIEIRQGID